MLFLTRTTLAAVALAATMSMAQAQPVTDRAATDPDHDAHHPGGAVTAQASPPALRAGPGAGPGTMGPGMMGNRGGMGMPFEHVEGRIAFLKAELGITDAQQPQWGAFADALRASAWSHRAMHERMMAGDGPARWPDRIARQREAMATRLDALASLEMAAGPLYGVLTEERKALADRLLSGPMGGM